MRHPSIYDCRRIDPSIDNVNAVFYFWNHTSLDSYYSFCCTTMAAPSRPKRVIAALGAAVNCTFCLYCSVLFVADTTLG